MRHKLIDTEDKAALMDSMILCKFLRGVFEDFHAEAASMLRSVTGWDVTADELRETAKRIVSAKRQFNLLAGMDSRGGKTRCQSDFSALRSRMIWRLSAEPRTTRWLGGGISSAARLVGVRVLPAGRLRRALPGNLPWY